MTKEELLNSVKENLANREKVDYPFVPDFKKADVKLKELFEKNAKLAAVDYYDISSVAEAQEIMRNKLPDAKVICSATQEWQGNKDINVQKPADLNDVDLGIFRAEFGVAEMGMVWITEKSLVTDSMGFLSQHLAVLLDTDDITENMHTAYKIANFPDAHYGCFMMGPSATADIGAVLVRGAQGARTLTLFFLKKP
ncbi:LUD domain-containing protein [Chryseobacterium sp. RR2-3-20]|uniref:LutC/YkgG family protein n=1 Tax=Chryseobacterium sp. RR2-3-20 TaxID=2787626 RepID=UPI001AE08574|nr:LUD domain-containing protein [Chryseobacterium sp. RR2-3-20]